MKILNWGKKKLTLDTKEGKDSSKAGTHEAVRGQGTCSESWIRIDQECEDACKDQDDSDSNTNNMLVSAKISRHQVLGYEGVDSPCAKYSTADDGSNPVHVRVDRPCENKKPNRNKWATQNCYITIVLGIGFCQWGVMSHLEAGATLAGNHRCLSLSGSSFPDAHSFDAI